jgi:predicted metal-dependent HD superfamily phosphohydrolase
MLQEIFHSLCRRNSLSQDETIQKLWWEIEQNYGDKGRHYHTLEHLENIISELEPYKEQVKDYDIILFSVFYHDIIYNIHQTDNEEKSAELAAKRLDSLAIAPTRAEACKKQIVATKTHVENSDYDINLFIDADMSVLGKDADAYNRYLGNVRKEYSFYPDLLYNNGRKAVLRHFLAMDHIYKTSEFRDKYEAQARENIVGELATLD